MENTQATQQGALVDNILKTSAVSKILGISRTTIFARINPKNRGYDPNFPKPLRLASNLNGFLESEVNAYIQMQAEKYRRTEPSITNVQKWKQAQQGAKAVND